TTAVAPTTVALTTVVPTSTSLVETTVASTEPPTTVPPETVVQSSLDHITGPMFSDALGIKVDTAPGVHTRGDTRQLLPEGLYVHLAWESDPNDFSVFSPDPEDIPILEAYTNAMQVFYTATTSTVQVDAATFGQFMVDSGDQYRANLDEARAGGYVGSLGSGVVLRPYLLHDQGTATTAVLLDCYLQNEQYVLRDGGVPVLAPLEPKGTIATMVLTASGWKIDVIASEPSACL
ncbi:MAG: hypothetical protein JWN99_2427, partial [Ilumatobacteraceae bacterium]|nr:hypothetical protein [Ilumatobacteraceae bacterium]